MLINWQKYNYRYLIFFLVLYSNSAISFAAKVNYNVDLSLTHYDNINQELNPPSDEWVEEITGRVMVRENSSKLVSNVNASLSALHYQNQQQEDAITGELYADALWIVKPKHFEWYALDVFTQTVINPLQSNTQSNRQDTNTFSTGPNYYIRINKLNNLNLEARAGRVTYSDTNEDNNRASTAVRWVYQANSAMTDSLNWEVEKLDFDDASINDYYRHHLYGRVDYIKGRNTFAAEAGVTRIDYKNQDDQQGQRYLVSLENQRTRNSSILLRYSHRITDTGAEILTPVVNMSVASPVPVTTPGLLPASDIYTDDTLSFEYNKVSLRDSLFINLIQSEQDFKTDNRFDQKSTSISVIPAYHFSQASLVRLEAYQVKTRYVNVSPLVEDTDKSLKIVYSRNISRNKILNFSYEKLERDSTDPTRNYKDNISMILFRYTSI